MFWQTTHNLPTRSQAGRFANRWPRPGLTPLFRPLSLGRRLPFVCHGHSMAGDPMNPMTTDNRDSLCSNAGVELNGNCRAVYGALRGAIYDLATGNVYSINESACEVVRGNRQNPLFIEKLRGLGLLADAASTRQKSSEVPDTRSYQLTFMWLEITSKCNLHCRHCYGSFGATSCSSNVLHLEDWTSILRQAKDLGCRRIQLTGGEFFLYPGSADLLEFIHTLKFDGVEVFTNATLLTGELAALLERYKYRAAVSLYSFDPETHDAITGVPGSYCRTMNGIELLRWHRVPTRIGLIVMSLNERTCTETATFVQKLGLRCRVDVLRRNGRGNRNSLVPSIETRSIYEFATRPAFKTSFAAFAMSITANNCWSGRIAVCANGDVIPCIFSRDQIVGNVRTQSLSDVLKGQKVVELWGITKDSVAVCRDCEYRYACQDCRPLSEAAFGDLYGSNPRCTYDPYTGKWCSPAELLVQLDFH